MSALLTSLPLEGQSAPKHLGLHTMKIGEIEAIVISDGHLVVNPVQAEFAPCTDFIQVADVLRDHFASTSEVDLGMNILLLKIRSRIILIDAGAGHVFGTESGWLTSNLRYAEIAPDQITDIVLTHAHPDHIGGLTSPEGDLLFPNAEVHLAQTEYDFWMSPKPDFSKSTMTDKSHMEMLVEVAQKTLRAVEGKLHLFHGGEELLGCMQLIPAPGHTPGHTAIRIYSQGEELYHLADVVHSETLSFTHPEWIYNSDTDSALGIVTRQKMLAQMATSKALFFSYHLPWPGLGYVKSDANGYRWIPKRIVMPY